MMKKKLEKLALPFFGKENTVGTAIASTDWLTKKKRKGIKVFPTLEDWKNETLEINVDVGFNNMKLVMKWKVFDYFIGHLLMLQKKKDIELMAKFYDKADPKTKRIIRELSNLIMKAK